MGVNTYPKEKGGWEPVTTWAGDKGPWSLSQIQSKISSSEESTLWPEQGLRPSKTTEAKALGRMPMHRKGLFQKKETKKEREVRIKQEELEQDEWGGGGYVYNSDDSETQEL